MPKSKRNKTVSLTKVPPPPTNFFPSLFKIPSL
jgi:hypothetical protein